MSDREPPVEVIRIRNDLTLDREQKIDAIIRWLVSRSPGAIEIWQLDILSDGEPLNPKPLEFSSEAAARAGLVEFVRSVLEDDEGEDADQIEINHEMLLLPEAAMVESYFAAWPHLSYRIEKFRPYPEEPGTSPEQGFVMMMMKDGTRRVWEPEMSRQWIAKAFLD